MICNQTDPEQATPQAVRLKSTLFQSASGILVAMSIVASTGCDRRAGDIDPRDPVPKLSPSVSVQTKELLNRLASNDSAVHGAACKELAEKGEALVLPLCEVIGERTGALSEDGTARLSSQEFLAQSRSNNDVVLVLLALNFVKSIAYGIPLDTLKKQGNDMTVSYEVDERVLDRIWSAFDRSNSSVNIGACTVMESFGGEVGEGLLKSIVSRAKAATNDENSDQALKCWFNGSVEFLLTLAEKDDEQLRKKPARVKNSLSVVGTILELDPTALDSQLAKAQDELARAPSAAVGRRYRLLKAFASR